MLKDLNGIFNFALYAGRNAGQMHGVQPGGERQSWPVLASHAIISV
jgi:hypothetical protein